MPFYGAQKEDAGYTAILETTNGFAFQYLVNSTFQDAFDTRGIQSPYVQIACAWPIWLSEKGKLGYERRMRFEFEMPLDYVGMAKAYRREAVAQGDLVTLREKAKARPQVVAPIFTTKISLPTGSRRSHSKKAPATIAIYWPKASPMLSGHGSRSILWHIAHRIVFQIRANENDRVNLCSTLAVTDLERVCAGG
jgi:hypothetical protein